MAKSPARLPNPKPTTINPKDSRYERGNFRGAGHDLSKAPDNLFKLPEGPGAKALKGNEWLG